MIVNSIVTQHRPQRLRCPRAILLLFSSTATNCYTNEAENPLISESWGTSKEPNPMISCQDDYEAGNLGLNPTRRRHHLCLKDYRYCQFFYNLWQCIDGKVIKLRRLKTIGRLTSHQPNK